MRVAIIGAGIGGMTAALALARRGLEVEVYERSPRLAEVGAGVSLSPNALKALYQLGLRPRLDAMSFVSETGALRTSRGGVLALTTAPQFVRRFGLPVMVFHRAELLDALVEAARGIPIQLGCECEGIDPDAGGVTVRFSRDRVERADVVVGADGLRSVIRAELGVPGALRYAGYTAWRGVAPFDTAGLIAGETLGCGRRFGLVPIAGKRVYWYATDNRAEGERDAAGAAKDALLGMFAGWHAPIADIIRATPAGTILRNDIYDRDPAPRWGAGRVTLLGDAAHPMTPNLGQGGCQAIEDALVLARCLAADQPEPALRAYEAARMPRTAFIVTSSRRVGRVFQLQSPAGCRLRNLMMRLTPAFVTYRSLAAVAGYEAHLDGAHQ